MSEIEPDPMEPIDEGGEERDAPPRPAWHKAHLVLMAVAGVALLMWLASGMYRVGAGEIAMVERLGEYLKTPDGHILAVNSGVHFGLPWPLDRVEKLNIQATHRVTIETFDSVPESYAKAKAAELRNNVPADVVESRYNPYLITADINVVHLTAVVQYRITDPEAYVFAVAQMKGHDRATREEMLNRVFEHELVWTISKSGIENLIYEGRSKVKDTLRERLQAAMSFPQEYQDGKAPPRKSRFGITIDVVDLPNVRPPDRVKSAFDDVGRASADAKIAKDRALGDEAAMLRDGEAVAKSILDDAEAYKRRVVESARGEESRFRTVLDQYKKDHDVARYDLWQATMKQVLDKANRVYFVQPDQMLYVPLPPPERPVNMGGPGQASPRP